MALRNIINIDASKCNGCGECVTTCAEGAIAIVDGVAKLIKDSYCDGLGACLGECPTGALTIIQREAVDFDEAAVEAHLKKENAPAFSCPSSQAKTWATTAAAPASSPLKSALTHWPVKLDLINPAAPVLQNADLLICADCVPFAYGGFHQELLAGKTVLIGCPKLNDTDNYLAKLVEIFRQNKFQRVTVAHMEVPCCFGLIRLVAQAAAQAKVELPLASKVITVQGGIKN